MLPFIDSKLRILGSVVVLPLLRNDSSTCLKFSSVKGMTYNVGP